MAEEDIQEKPISLPETIFFMSVTVIAEIIEFLLADTGFGVFIAVPISLFVGLTTMIWLYFKGNRGYVKGKVTAYATKRLSIYAFGALADTFTGGFLPLKMITLGVTIFMLNHPKIEKVTEEAVELYEEFAEAE